MQTIQQVDCMLLVLPWLLDVSRQVHEVKVSGMRRHKLEIQSTDNSNPNTDNFRLIVVRTPSHTYTS